MQYLHHYFALAFREINMYGRETILRVALEMAQEPGLHAAFVQNAQFTGKMYRNCTRSQSRGPKSLEYEQMASVLTRHTKITVTDYILMLIITRNS